MFNNAITPCLAVIYYIGTYYYMQALLIYSIYYTQLGLPAYQKSRVSFHWIIIRFTTSIFGNCLDSVINILRVVSFSRSVLVVEFQLILVHLTLWLLWLLSIQYCMFILIWSSMWFRLCCIICRVLLMSLHTLEIIFSCCYN